MSRKDDTVTVNVDDFTRTRDSVIVSLAQLQAAVSKLSEAYINHANTVLNRGPTVDIGNIASITNSLYESGLLGALGGGARATSPGAKSEVGEKKKRKRAPPDPNAPKRALTPFFLYMQHNRTKISEEMGPSAKPKDVSDEGTRRWAEMPEEEKEHWKKMYADNLAVYKEKMAAYKAGLPYTDDAKAANQLQQEADRAETTPAEESEEEEEEVEEEEEEEPEPVREPTPPRAGKRRRSEAAKAAKDVASPADTKKASPEKKRTRTPASREKKVQEETPASTRKSAATENKRGKKKRKSEAAAEE
ncbi:hypothetical protein AFLA_000797 [Aspergillus flavus NRRL3357]|nr:hypothetical protein AFLA_000797 [Aspergillus flavus NRRL3357]